MEKMKFEQPNIEEKVEAESEAGSEKSPQAEMFLNSEKQIIETLEAQGSKINNLPRSQRRKIMNWMSVFLLSSVMSVDNSPQEADARSLDDGPAYITIAPDQADQAIARAEEVTGIKIAPSVSPEKLEELRNYCREYVTNNLPSPTIGETIHSSFSGDKEYATSNKSPDNYMKDFSSGNLESLKGGFILRGASILYTENNSTNTNFLSSTHLEEALEVNKPAAGYKVVPEGESFIVKSSGNTPEEAFREALKSAGQRIEVHVVSETVLDQKNSDKEAQESLKDGISTSHANAIAGVKVIRLIEETDQRKREFGQKWNVVLEAQPGKVIKGDHDFKPTLD